MKGMVKLLLLSFLSFTIFYGVGCAGSKPKPTPVAGQEAVEPDNGAPEDEIEKLLGLDESGGNQADTQSQPAAEEQQEEDDLLKLLEGNQNNQPNVQNDASANTPTTPSAPNAQRRLQQLEQQVRNLQRQVEQQKQTIARLNAQLLAKEEEIRQLKEQNTAQGQMAFSYDGNYESQYKQALDLFHNRQYQQAIQVFQQLVNQNPNHPLADNAQYWIGESYFALGQYQKAIIEFEKVFLFDQSNKNDYAQYKLGLCYYLLGNKQRARAEFQKLIDRYPRSELVAKARRYLQKIS